MDIMHHINIILDNLDRIHSMCSCFCKRLFTNTLFLDLDKSYHTYCEQGWERLVCENTKHPFWIGVTEKISNILLNIYLTL